MGTRHILIRAAVLLLVFNFQLSTFNSAWAQKPKVTAEFAAETMPADLQEYLNKNTTDKGVQKDNAKVIEAFGAAYAAMDAQLQQRVTNLYIYAVGVKIKALPELVDFTRVLTAYAATPNLEGWVASMETYRKKNSKVKYINDFVAWSDLLLSDRVLYRSNSSEWSFGPQTPFRLTVENGTIVARFDTPSDLNYASSKDWNTLHGTKGWYDYKEGVWHGQGGRLDWSRTGLGAEACYADLHNYKAEA